MTPVTWSQVYMQRSGFPFDKHVRFSLKPDNQPHVSTLYNHN